MRRARKTPLSGNAFLSEWRFPLSECHWGGGGGVVNPFERISDCPAMRSPARRMLTSLSPERPRLSVESLWVPGWPVSTSKRRYQRHHERTIGDGIREPEASMTRAARRTQSLESDRLRYAYSYITQ